MRLERWYFLVLVFLSFWFGSVSSAWAFPSCAWVGKSFSLDRDCALAELLTWSRPCRSSALWGSVLFRGVCFPRCPPEFLWGSGWIWGAAVFSDVIWAAFVNSPIRFCWTVSLRRVGSLNCPKSLSMRSWEQNTFSKVQLGFETPVICKRKYLDEICSPLCSFCSHNFVLDRSKSPSALCDPTSSLLGEQEKETSLFSQGDTVWMLQHDLINNYFNDKAKKKIVTFLVTYAVKYECQKYNDKLNYSLYFFFFSHYWNVQSKISYQGNLSFGVFILSSYKYFVFLS